jgi:glycosyltransferase involved in cell wall biosynthesis
MNVNIDSSSVEQSDLKNDIKFSIVTISLNSEEDIETAIVSVADQTYKNKEHIIIDGGSQDSTVDIIRKHKEHLSYWVSEPDNGIADAFNKGIEQATGDYILFINSDDFLIDKKALEYICDAIQDQVDYYIFQVMSILPDKTRKLMPNRNFGLSTYFKMGSCHQGHVISRKLFEKYGGYDNSFKIGMDYDFVLRVKSQRVESRSVDVPISCMGQAGISSRKDWAGLRQRFMDERMAQEKNCDNVVLKAIYPLYWFVYLTYRKAVYFAATLSSSD